MFKKCPNFRLRLHVVRKWSTLWLYLVLSYKKCPTLHFLEQISCLLSFRTENERCSKLRSGLRWHPNCTYSVAKTIGWPRYKVHFPLKIRKPCRKLTIHCCNSTHSTQPSSIAIKRIHPPPHPPPFPHLFYCGISQCLSHTRGIPWEATRTKVGGIFLLWEICWNEYLLQKELFVNHGIGTYRYSVVICVYCCIYTRIYRLTVCCQPLTRPLCYAHRCNRWA